jgi:hypothetical protein
VGVPYEITSAPAERGWQRRKRWLDGQSARMLNENFLSQPWIQLAHKLDQQGHHAIARRVRIERRLREAKRARWLERLLSHLLYRTARYGHEPMRAVAHIVIWIAIFGFFWWGAMRVSGQFAEASSCANEAKAAVGCLFVRTAMHQYAQIEQQRGEGVAGDSYPAFNPLGFSLDIFLPLLDIGYQESWTVNTSFQPLYEVRIPADLIRVTKVVVGILRGKSSDAPSQGMGTEADYEWFAVPLTVGGVVYAFYLGEMIWGFILTSIAVAGFSGLLTRED